MIKEAVDYGFECGEGASLMKRRTCLPTPILSLVKKIVNTTPTNELGYAEAADRVNENWGEFVSAGASVGDLEAITGLIRWRKSEGFCEDAPLS